jgi:hypothetical protein
VRLNGMRRFCKNSGRWPGVGGRWSVGGEVRWEKGISDLKFVISKIGRSEVVFIGSGR